ncbi:GLPGLI family protein [Riemerella anatipestifer]|uniref:GLPGLI family protein n=1 Tax=Riemerella anatipestifer TaxID=34085 RepID=UPI0021A44B8E|nr:GLPGLI family protein [Riemerella anatipestifer]UWS40268.1 GLPGLI family protein [Riemerella anatipestifer]
MKGIILLCFLIGNFIFGQNISIQYAVEKNGYHQDFILDVLPSYSFFYSTEYCTPKEEEIFNYIKVENTKQGIIFHDEIENIKVYYKSNIKLKWELLPETQIYEGVKLNKARTKYKNVEYVAWYDSNAAVNEGPFIFKNLPGVIYKVESEGIKINLLKSQIKMLIV